MSVTDRGGTLKFVCCDHGFNFQKNVRMQIETILHTVSKFQANHACFYRAPAGANFSGIKRKKK